MCVEKRGQSVLLRECHRLGYSFCFCPVLSVRALSAMFSASIVVERKKSGLF